ncbi:MAG: mechanosensitive ion channel family protein [Geobacteraceae bacterium]|nr:mechanosensitive ion channel family protein [Geobacteraceae bacterium]
MFQRVIILLLLIITAATLAFAAPKATKNAPSPKEPPKPPIGRVVLEGKPLFTVQEKILSLTPEDRASRISARLARLARNPLFKAETITTIEGETTTDIATGEIIIMTVTEKDAEVTEKPRSDLAKEYAATIRAAIEETNYAYSIRSIVIGALYAILATAVLVALLIAITRLFPKLIARIQSYKGTRIRTIRFQSLDLLQEDRIVAFLITTARVFRMMLILILFYIYIPLVFSFFPWTRGFSAKLFQYFMLPLQKIWAAFASYLPNIFYIGIIIALTHFANKFCRFFFTQIEKKTIIIPGFFPEWADASFKIVRFLIIAFAAVVAFPYLPGAESPAFRGISVFLGVLFSLGSTSAVANVVAGVILAYMRAFKLSDRVKIADTVGDVVEKTLLVTRIRTIKNVDITIPNAMVLGSHIINYSSSAKDYGLILNTSVTIGYDEPWRKVHETLIEAAKATENILELPAPFVFQTSLDDFYVSYELNAYTEKPSIMAKIYSDLHQNIQEKFNEAGIEIMSPHYAQIRDGNRTTIPREYLPAGYEPEGIRIMRTEKDSPL